MKERIFCVFLAALATVSVATAQQAPIRGEAPEYSGVPYYNLEGVLIRLPTATPNIKHRLKTSLSFPEVEEAIEVTATNLTFLVRLEGSGDPSMEIWMAPIEQGGRVAIKKGSFEKEISLVFKNLGSRVFEVTPVTPLPVGEYTIAVAQSDSLFVPAAYFVFRTK